MNRETENGNADEESLRGTKKTERMKSIGYKTQVLLFDPFECDWESAKCETIHKHIEHESVKYIAHLDCVLFRNDSYSIILSGKGGERFRGNKQFEKLNNVHGSFRKCVKKVIFYSLINHSQWTNFRFY